ncbi:hypothetical protein QUB70_04710 [Microcoleus sp. A003_D6]|uniref:hypothetical protein n=1 Tax=Microcoleus sp. A003_D6 TaxID=3055266 RepID=UPI002FD0581B
MTRLDGVRFDRDRGYYLDLWDERAHLKAPLELPTAVRCAECQGFWSLRRLWQVADSDSG